MATDRPYALAFGHFGNKNADAVIAGWAEFCHRATPSWVLRLVGMGSADRAAAAEQVERLGIADRVELMPWLDDDAFQACFAGAGLVIFPSDFEGFGLPAVEAMRLGIPLVVSDDPALAEVTGGHAVTARTTTGRPRHRDQGGSRPDARPARRRSGVHGRVHVAPYRRSHPRRSAREFATLPVPRRSRCPRAHPACPACGGLRFRSAVGSRATGRRISVCRDCGVHFWSDHDAAERLDAIATQTEMSADDYSDWVDIKREEVGPDAWRDAMAWIS